MNSLMPLTIVWWGCAIKSCCQARKVLQRIPGEINSQSQCLCLGNPFGMTKRKRELKWGGENIPEGVGKKRREQTKGKRKQVVDDKEMRKSVTPLSQLPFSSFIHISFRHFFSQCVWKCLWMSATASTFLLACTPCGQPETQTPQEEEGRGGKKD